MKKHIKTITYLLFCIPLLIQVGCTNHDKEVKQIEADAKEAKQEMKALTVNEKQEAQWIEFKAEANEKIRQNEIRISEIREKMKRTGKAIDAVYEKKIANLEKKNYELKAKINKYENDHSDWESFKAEFNHDMDEIGNSFKGLGEDDK